MLGRRLRRTSLGWVLAAGFAALLAPALVAFAGKLTCEVPAELMDVDADAKLPHLSERLRAGGPVKIVAIGGASTAGLAAGATDLAYPHRLQQTLAGWYPAVPVTVVNKGVPRQTAEQMLARFPKDVFAEKPVLVIWETGTTDAVRGVDVDEFAATLQSGVDMVAARAIDLIFVDMQFSRRTLTVIDFESYLRAIHRVGDVKDIYVFPRFEMMRYWSGQEVFNLDGVQGSDRASLAANVYECLGRRLADAIRIALQ
jgi:acyl-CoA thioesterase I